jgi:hypothetical protein
VSLEMEHIPDLEWSGFTIDEHNTGAMERVRKSKAFKATSNAVEVDVLPAERSE